MNDTEIRDRLRDLTRAPRGIPDLPPVERRARVLRWRRAGAVAVSAALAIAAIAIPLSGLRHLGEASPSRPAAGPPAISFGALDGWTTSTATAPAFAPFGQPAIAATIANVALPAADPESVYPPRLTNNQIDALPADGVAIQAQQTFFTRNPMPPDSDYPPAALPLDIADASVTQGPREGLDREDVTSYTLMRTVNDRSIIAQAWFGTAHPSDDLLRRAQRALDQLVVVPAPPRTTAIDDVGVTMSLPDGWNGFLYSYGDGMANLVATTGYADTLWPTANTSPGPGDAAIVLQESDALVELQGWAPLSGPVSIGPFNICDGCEVLDDGRPPPSGQVVYQNTFTTQGRAFDVYVEFGSSPSQARVDEVNAVLGTLTFEPIVDASYTPAPGTTRVGPIYDGEDKPEVTADQQDRQLTWAYQQSKMTLPAGWTGQSYPVAGLERPAPLLAAGSWDFTPGGYCGPINALRELPADGAFVWFDGYGSNPPDGMSFAPQPSSVSLSGAETDPSPCFGGSTPYVFRWSIGDRYVVAHAAVGSDASASTIAQVETTLASIAVG